MAVEPIMGGEGKDEEEERREEEGRSGAAQGSPATRIPDSLDELR